MLDSGATGLFINRTYAATHQLTLSPLRTMLPLYNIDGSPNKAGAITQFCRLRLTIGNHDKEWDFLVTDLGPEDVILGLPWLREVNPRVDWEGGTMEINEAKPQKVEANRKTRRMWARAGIMENGDELWTCAAYTYSQQIAEETIRTKGDRTFEDMVPEEYRQHAHVFSEEDSHRLPEHKPWDHTIDLKDDAPETLRTRAFPMSPPEDEELGKFLEESLAKGYIVPSKSPMASPVFFVKKKEGSLRLVQDYRKLNDITIKNRYPLPLASDIINKLKGARIFTKFDVRWGYHNIRIKESDQWKAAFVTNRGLFEPRVMFFGLTNSPATFQALMNTIFADLIAENKLAVYMDDILIYSSDKEVHRETTHEVLRRLKEYDLFLKPEKCEFDKDEIEYLGMVIRAGEVGMDPAKVQAVANWHDPRNLRDLRGFLGFANFYRRFIKDFARKARPLNDLTKKDTLWRWGESEQKAFAELKGSFTKAPVLTMYDPTRPTEVEVDASNFATGGVLSQKCDDGLWRPVAYRSETMTPAERNYEIYDKEFLAIIRALEDWRHFLEGLPNEFTVISDHKNWEYWTRAQNLTRRQARWSLWLSRFNLTITHRPGKTMGKADAMTRSASSEVSDAEDNRDQIVLVPRFLQTIAATAAVAGPNPLEERIRQSSQREAEVVAALERMKKTGPRKLANGAAEWEEEDGLVFYRGKLYVPNEKELRRDIVRECHDTRTAGHPGRDRTLELVSRHYWWPLMRSFVDLYVRGCEQCQRFKPASHPRTDPLLIAVPEGPWQIIGVDLVTGLPPSKGLDGSTYNAIATYVDLYTKQAHFALTTEEVNSDGIAAIHERDVFKLHGLPRAIISDRGPQFASKLIRALYKRLGINGQLTTAYHPQANGQTERMNQEIEQYLRMFTRQRQDDWAKLLPVAEFALNSRISAATQRSPFEMLYGYQPDFTIPAGGRSNVPAADARLDLLQQTRLDAEAALRLSKEAMSQDPTPSRSFAIGDRVWLDVNNVHIHQAARKLGPKQLGPYPVIGIHGDRDYRLELPPRMNIHNVFHVDRLSLWKGNDVNGELPPPPQAVIVDGEEEYEVDDILDSRMFRRRLEYLVKWKGYDSGSTTWEPATNLSHASAKVRAFHKRFPNAVQRLNAALFASLPWQRLVNHTVAATPDFSWEEGRVIASSPTRTSDFVGGVMS